MADDAETGSRRRIGNGAGAVIALVFILPVLYVLSVGPVAAVTGPFPPDAVVKFYAPLKWLHDHTVLRKPLEKYVELWGAKP